jgi:hypothetical protein
MAIGKRTAENKMPHGLTFMHVFPLSLFHVATHRLFSGAPGRAFFNSQHPSHRLKRSDYEASSSLVNDDSYVVS